MQHELEDLQVKRLLSGAGLTAEEQETADAAMEARRTEREERKLEQRQQRNRDDAGRFAKGYATMSEDEFNKHLAGFGVSRFASVAGANR